MGEDVKKLYACCPICARAIGKSKRSDGLEMPCPKCGSPLKITINEENGVSVQTIEVQFKCGVSIEKEYVK